MLPVCIQRACAVYYLCKSGPLSLYVVTVAKTPLSEEEGEREREREREREAVMGDGAFVENKAVRDHYVGDVCTLPMRTQRAQVTITFL